VVTDPNVSPALCFPGKAEVAEAVAKITGKELGSIEGAVAVVHCARCLRSHYEKYDYVGYGSCSAASLAFAGPTDCQFGCVGFGDCARACPFGAITMVHHFPVIDPEICTGCGICMNACPKALFSLIPRRARIVVRCSSRDSGKETHRICSSGCLHCLSCVRACPAGAVALVDGLIRVDHPRCLEYGTACREACLQACFMIHVIQPLQEHPLLKAPDEITPQEALAL
jgi:electron transport complex protein RnfB